MASHEQWNSKTCILVITKASSIIIPADDLKDYLHKLVGASTQIRVKDTPNVGEKFVHFDSEQAAQCILDKTDHQIRTPFGYIYAISVRHCSNIQATKYMKPDMASSKSSESHSSRTEGASSTMTLQDGWDRKTIIVQGLDPYTPHEDIKTFFEDQHQSGGGATKKVDLDKNKGVAYVTFVHAGVARTVLAKPRLHLGGYELKVYPLVRKEESTDDPQGLDGSHRQGDTRGQDVSHRQDELHREGKSRKQAESGRQEESGRGQYKNTQNMWGGKTIQVTGLKAKTTGDAIVLLFESKLPDDEDPILRVQRHPDKDVIYITFTTAEVAQKVLSVPTFTLEDAILNVQPARGIKHRQLIPVHVGFSEPQVAKNAQKVLSMKRLSLEGAVLTVGRKQPDPRDQQEETRGEEPEPTTGYPEWDQQTIEVSKFRPDTSEGTFKRCFQNKVLCPCGGEVEEVDTTNQSSGIVYVKFKEPGVAASVISLTSMTVGGVVVEMMPCLRKTSVGTSPQEPPGTQDVKHTTIGQSRNGTTAKRPEPEETTRRPIKLELHKLRMLHAQRFKTEQEEKFPGMTVAIDTRGGTVTFDGKESDVAKAVEAMHGLVDSMEQSSLEMSAELIKLLRGITTIRHMVGVFKKKDICAVYEAAGDTTLGVYALDEDNLEKAIEVIKTETCDETCTESTEAFQTEEWDALKEDLQSKYEGLLTITESGGRIILSGMVNPVATAKVPILLLAATMDIPSDGSTVLDSVKRGGCTVQVVRGDLTTFHAEAIVNAANGELEHCGGLGKAIVDAGGSEIQWECRDYVRQHGTFKPGQVYVSESGHLPCKKVIHAVGPRWQGGFHNEERDLCDAVNESMMAAEKYGLTSIAFPALSTGALQFPIDKCTKITIAAVKDFLDSHQQTCLKKVSLVHKTDHVLGAFRKSLGFMSGAATTRHVAAVHGQAQTSTRRTSASAQPTGATASVQHRPGPTGGVRRHASIGDDTPIQIGPLKIEIVQGDLSKEYTAAIVNVTDKWFTQTGAISRAIFDTGGQAIEKACQALGNMPSSGIAMTIAGDLSCSRIIHVVAAHSDASWTGMIQDVLSEANYQQFKSVAFPVLCTATIMREVINRFIHTKPDCLKLVRIVTLDQTTMESFKECFLKGPAVPPDSFPSYPPGTAVGRSAGPVGTTTELSSTHVSTFSAPHPSAMDPLSATGGATSHINSHTSTRIGALTIEILHGDLTKQETDAIVNSSDEHFNLSGAASMAIAKAGGQAFVDECQRFGRMPSSGIVVTGAGNLPCLYVIHINARMDLTSIIADVLVKADQLHISSVAFPALGTGVLGLTPIEAASNMFNAIKCFTVNNPNPQYLKLVKVVIFDNTIMESFRQCFLEQGNASGPVEPVYPSTHRTRPGRASHTQVQVPVLGAQSSGNQRIPTALEGAQRHDNEGARSDSGRAQGHSGVQVQWMAAEGSTFRNYLEEMNYWLEMAYIDKGKTYTWTDMITGKQRHICWDKLKDKMKNKSIKRAFTFGGVELPANWTGMDTTRHDSTVKLDQASKEYKEVLKNVTERGGLSAKGRFEITRIQNPVLYLQYVLCRDEILKRSGHRTINEYHLWHNISRDVVDDISANGFTVIPVMFTKSPPADQRVTRSAQGMRYVYQARVVTGDYRMGTIKRPSIVDPRTGHVYDSIFDVDEDAYVVFSDHQAYPEYLITY